MAQFLVVEDYPPMASLLAMAIRRDGHTVVRAGSVAAARAIGGRFDFAVLDVDLPDGNGVVLARELLAADRVASGVLFFTASRDAKQLSEAADIGFLVDKAAGHDRLMAAVRMLVEQREAGRILVVGTPEALDIRVSGRSGLRRKVDRE